MKKQFAHLHLHTEYSLLDGACRIKRLIKHVKSLGQEAVAITDHGVMFGAIDFYKECKKEGIKPIIGCEVYVAQRTRHDRMPRLDSSSYHLVLLCKNNTGYQNLIKMVSQASIDGFYNKPRVDKELLKQYSEGLIATSACLAGEIPRALMANDYQLAKERALYYKGVFGDDFYIEIMDHGIEEQTEILPKLIKLSKETEIPLIATNDCHYIEKADWEMQHVLMCIQLNKKVDDKDGLEFPTKEFYVKSTEEMYDLFSYVPEALENTVKITEKCNLDFEFGVTKLPHYTAPDGISNEEFFVKQCYEGLYKYYGDSPKQEILDRLEYELSIIIKMGYVDYYLIVFDFIDFARKNDIPVGAGRGSGAGSLAAYCIGITGIDPIKYNLLFERFLNPERISMPDFDIDFCYERRSEVIDYVVTKYGSDHVAQIITFGTMAARGAIRDVGRALGIAYSTVDIIAKLIPTELGITIEKALKRSPELKNQYDKDEIAKNLIDLSIKLEGMPRHASTHAAGVVITKDEVSSYVPLTKNDEYIVTQFPMTTLEELGLLKMDFLGLRNLTIIKNAVDEINSKGENVDIDKIDLEDKAVYDMLSNGSSLGVFQFESAGMRQVLANLKPINLEDLIAVISLYRPGPMDSIDTYIDNRFHPENIKYKTPLLKPILDVTNGCIVYQEQVMDICKSLAGFSLGKADLVRRAMSKKKADVMEHERENFIVGCGKNGVSKDVANSIFDDMSSFAAYAFNKSHAAAYAYLSYQTAWLKCHYSKEYMAALLTSIIDNTDKVIDYINECKNININILRPDINKSFSSFTVEGENIRFGLLAVKNLGRNVIKSIVEERAENGEFLTFYNFCKRMYDKDINKRSMESLISCGALDGLGLNRKSMLANFEKVLSALSIKKKTNIEGQFDFFATPEVVENENENYVLVDEFSASELLNMEKESTGIFITGHPLEQYKPITDSVKCVSFADLNDENTSYKDGDNIKTLCYFTHVNLKTTRSNATMAFITAEDMTGQVEVIVFPKTATMFSKFLVTGTVAMIEGHVNYREDEGATIICDKILSTNVVANNIASVKIKNSKEGIYLKLKNDKDKNFTKVLEVLDLYVGDFPVYLYFEDTKQLKLAPKRYWASPNDNLISDLKEILGEKSVAIK